MPAKVYLAGPITGLSFDKAADWRYDVMCLLGAVGIVAYSPLRAKSYLKNIKEIADHYDDHVLSCRKGITNRDRFDVMRCDVLFVNLIGATKPSIGTILELGWADAARKPIVLCMDEGNVHDHAMVNEVSGFVVRTLDEGVEVTKSLLLHWTEDWQEK
jgi:nucleoside 2-deoxyribosyltransferase